MSDDKDRQIADLQEYNTKLLNELRMKKAQLGAARRILHIALVESPMNRMSALMHGEEVNAVLHENKQLLEIYKRIELLEHDAWTQTTGLVRQFIIETVIVYEDQAIDLIKNWRERFSKAING